jgi:hypothetical protein
MQTAFRLSPDRVFGAAGRSHDGIEGVSNSQPSSASPTFFASSQGSDADL